jgi:hypothetical protein
LTCENKKKTPNIRGHFTNEEKTQAVPRGEKDHQKRANVKRLPF